MALAQARNAATWPDLQRQVEQAQHDYRTLGVATSFGEWQKNVNAIARALDPGGGLPPMVLNCGGPSFKLTPEYLLQEVRPRLIDVVARIEGLLQH